MIEELRIVGYVALGLIAIYVSLRLLAERAVKRLIRSELDSVVSGDEFKTKGRFE